MAVMTRSGSVGYFRIGRKSDAMDTGDADDMTALISNRLPFVGKL